MFSWERLNSNSHLLGALLALVGVVILLTRVAGHGGLVELLSFSVYGVSLFLLYLVSSLYHRPGGRRRPLLRLLDHQAIYLLIAGTYTPFTLITLKGRVGWSLFAAIWGMALLGILLDALHESRPRILPVVIYLVMGWLVVFALGPLLESLPAAGFRWLLAGGMLYSAGVVFFILDHWFPWAHPVWHLFVLAGSISHYFAILLYV